MSIQLNELTPQQQFAVLKLYMKGEVPFFEEQEVELPPLISARYVCAECGKFIIPTFHLEDIKGGISNRIKCSPCGGNMSLYLMGTGLETEIKKAKKNIQRHIDDYFF